MGDEAFDLFVPAFAKGLGEQTVLSLEKAARSLGKASSALFADPYLQCRRLRARPGEEIPRHVAVASWVVCQ
jgi:hypothetical protein